MPNDHMENADLASKAVKAKKASKEEDKGKRAQRTTSNKFSQLSQDEMEEFKQAFQLIDADKDGIISKSDLKQTFDSLGQMSNDAEIDGMLAEASGPLSFAMFLTLFGEKFSSVADPVEMLTAFKLWDTDDSGMIDEDGIREDLKSRGEKFTNEDLDVALRDAPVYEKDGKAFIDYKAFVNLICAGNKEGEEEKKEE
ncbi:unnamed protein product [Notodromas monacha]|uniref:EF-hand domain-containing protein n=1 Tax=Notodromas monacha TaxID=399045 RepID=A0A7R9BT38_9CRUS|nr:unnamed protein product [Notodromas monacha]CAG0921249.1 unnamed protein product [Notodromas monacha]